jgi:hypothetical protein
MPGAERRVHHARVRALIRDAVRAASVLEHQLIGIELDAPTVRAREHVLQSPNRHDDASEHGPGAYGPVPSLAIAILVVGSRGDVQPFIPIACRLARDGHRVRLATHAVFREFVESHGIEFFPLAASRTDGLHGDDRRASHPAPPRSVDGQVTPAGIMAEILASTWGVHRARPWAARCAAAWPTW